MNLASVDKKNSILLENCQTIKKQLVHRIAINEVFLTDMKQLSNNSNVIAAQLPKTHMYFNDVENGYYDATLLLQVFRQVSICITHHLYNISYSTKFIFSLDTGCKTVWDKSSLD
ncbi:AfsA-related hotdog domain-containing protein [Gilliamella sp. ESL0254]|uniref:AfsA-related hotdog domain-containing protein n=1 Tax=Gilliamella sp. ESL0254 TaxID=2705035 RepID=UPI001580A0FD|nr:AfsA-related hotdog domain-containing protein [Gilliamella sp. ESL0254]NUF27073.1 hypothetical protein [Gilliamella sp. ESL0254]